MNYQKIYNQLIEKRKNVPVMGYKERHHIIPRSLGGTDDPDNIVDLTLREHFIAHRLLIKITTGSNQIRMIDAVWGMINRTRMKLNSHCYEIVRSQFIEAASIRAKQQWEDGKAIPPPNHSETKWWYHPNHTKHVRSKQSPGDGWINGKRPTNFKQQVKTYVNGIEFNTGKDASKFIGCAPSVITAWRDRGIPYKGEFLISSSPN